MTKRGKNSDEKESKIEKIVESDSVIIPTGVISLGENELSRVFDTDQYGVIFNIQNGKAIVEIGVHNDMLYTYNVNDLKKDEKRRYRKNSNS